MYKAWTITGFGVLCLVTLGGCTREDNDRLAKIGRILQDRTGDVAGDLQTDLTDEWKKLQAQSQNRSVARRVTDRLRNDKTLTGVDIEVLAQGTEIELRGKVRNGLQQQRAVELVRSTLGVTKVVDRLQVGE